MNTEVGAQKFHLMLILIKVFYSICWFLAQIVVKNPQDRYKRYECISCKKIARIAETAPKKNNTNKENSEGIFCFKTKKVCT
jgi:hypothetical protein